MLNMLEVGEWVRRYEGAVWSDSMEIRPGGSVKVTESDV